MGFTLKICPVSGVQFNTTEMGVDLVVMSAELYERFAQINRIDQAIYEAEKEVEEGAKPISMNSAIERLNQKYYG